ncbi:MAG: DUF4625 domain-containing protein [bacterium]
MRTIIQNTVKVFTVILFLITAISCKDNDEIKMPEILEFELGHDNSKTVRAGGDLHTDAEMIAENGIDVIEIGIHPEDTHKKSLGSASNDHPWVVDIIYDKFRGLKNTTFHEDLDVPVDAFPGEYHFHFKVTDMEGYTVSFEEELVILDPAIK